jgi:hypothetical protein
MPSYELQIEDREPLGPINAKDPDHALAIFGRQLGLRLRREERPDDAAPYAMLRETTERNAAWIKAPKISVWIDARD